MSRSEAPSPCPPEKTTRHALPTSREDLYPARCFTAFAATAWSKARVPSIARELLHAVAIQTSRSEGTGQLDDLDASPREGQVLLAVGVEDGLGVVSTDVRERPLVFVASGVGVRRQEYADGTREGQGRSDIERQLLRAVGRVGDDRGPGDSVLKLGSNVQVKCSLLSREEREVRQSGAYLPSRLVRHAQ
jgi:hypothetical protein